MRKKLWIIVTGVILSGAFWSCDKGKKSNTDSARTDSVIEYTNDENYHADNDIAMTLMSIADALKQGEQLDSIDYNFDGVLTDGTGRPLYTDIQGTPGTWTIRVESPTTVSIKNVYLGDLLPESLKNYIVQSFGLDDEAKVDTSKFHNEDISDSIIYLIDGGYLIFNTDTALTPAGKEGPLMTIVITANEIEEFRAPTKKTTGVVKSAKSSSSTHKHSSKKHHHSSKKHH